MAKKQSVSGDILSLVVTSPLKPTNVPSSTVIKCLEQIFAIFDMPSYMHSDRGPFTSLELEDG
jgi:hypothetical protein